MAEEELGLADAIDAVRSELAAAQDRGRHADVRFAVGKVDVEFAVEVTRSAGAEASVKVLRVLSLGGKGEVAKGETHRVKVELSPLGVGGRPFEVASPQVGRPDARE